MQETEDQFIRRWSERAYDQSQLAALAAIYEHMIDYALNGWRSMEILPPRGVMLICACDDGLELMSLSPMGDWRTNSRATAQAAFRLDARPDFTDTSHQRRRSHYPKAMIWCSRNSGATTHGRHQRKLQRYWCSSHRALSQSR